MLYVGALYFENKRYRFVKKNAIIHGSSVTNTFATRVSKKFVAGHFSPPPPTPKLSCKLDPCDPPSQQNPDLHQRFPPIWQEFQRKHQQHQA
jgi:hypothetical protein